MGSLDCASMLVDSASAKKALRVPPSHAAGSRLSLRVRAYGNPLRHHLTSNNPYSFFFGIQYILETCTRKLPRFAPPREGGTLAGPLGRTSDYRENPTSV